MDEDERILQGLARRRRDLVFAEDMMGGHEPSARDALLGIALGGEASLDELDAGPDAAGILPAAARSADPLAEDGAGKHKAALVFRKLPGEARGLAGGPHAGGDQRSEKVGGNGEARTFGDVVHRGDQLQSPPRPDEHGEDFRKRFSRTLDAGRDESGGDDRRFQQAEVVFRKIENIGERLNLGGGFQVDAGESQHRAVDHPQVGGYGRLWFLVRAVDREVDGDIDDLRALGEIHAEEENIRPRGVREIHANGRAFQQDGIAVTIVRKELAADAQRVLGGVTHAEHPLVAAHGADGFTDLVGECLESELVIRGGKGGGDRIAGALFALRGEEGIDGLGETPREEMAVSFEGDVAVLSARQNRQVVAVDRIKEKQGADALVEVAGSTAERVERGCLGEELFAGKPGAGFRERAVAEGGFVRGDDVGEHGSAGGCHQLDEHGEDLVPLRAGESHGELGAEQAVGLADIVALPRDLEGEVALALRRGGEGGCERQVFSGCFQRLFQQPHRGGGEDVHSEEAEVVTLPQAGCDELLFGHGGRRFFEDVVDLIEIAAAWDVFTADGSVIRKLPLSRGLNSGNRALLALRRFQQLPDAGIFPVAQVEVIADEKQERFAAGETLRAENGMAVAERLGLLDELDLRQVRANGGAEGIGLAGGDNEGRVTDSRVEDFIEQKLDRRLALARGTDDGLEGQVPLVRPCGGDDGFVDFHGDRESRGGTSEGTKTSKGKSMNA